MIARCDHCSAELFANEAFCSGCGRRVVAPAPAVGARCPFCMASSEPGEAHCAECGRALTPSAAPAAPPVAAAAAPQSSSLPRPAGDSARTRSGSKRPLIVAVSLVAAVAAGVVSFALLSGDDAEEGRLSLEPEMSLASESSTASSVAPQSTESSTTSAAGTSETIAVATLATTTTIPSASLRRFPTSAPSCVLAEMDPELDPDEWFSNCIGAFGFARFSAALDRSFRIYRWTGTEWQSRGAFAAYCTSDLVPSGMPNDYAKELAFPGTRNSECYDILLHPESSSGPLSFNDEGPRVRELQLRLIGANLLLDEADGEYGPNTLAAVTDLQYLFGLAPTGVADESVFVILGL